MVTKNVRVVGYLPPPYHLKLREYMQAQSLTESAALGAIIKQFFDGSGSTGNKSANTESSNAVAELKADITAIQGRLVVLEQARRGFQSYSSKPRRSTPYGIPPVLPPQSSSELALRRLS